MDSDSQTSKPPPGSLDQDCSAIDEAKTLALLNTLRALEHVLWRAGAPEDTIAGMLDGDMAHVIWWADTKWPNDPSSATRRPDASENL